MTNETLVRRIEELRGTLANDTRYSVYATDTLAEAIRRLTPQEPPPGSVRVRVAVAVGNSEIVQARGVDRWESIGDAIGNVRSQVLEFGDDMAITNGPVVIEADIPPNTIPIVQGTVEEVADA